MTYVVTEACIKCKYMDCVEVCPVDCFYEGENMLVIHPDECIDCGVCEPECPAEAIMPDSEKGPSSGWSSTANTRPAWPNITRKGEPPADADEWKGCKDKFDKYFSPKPGPGPLIARGMAVGGLASRRSADVSGAATGSTRGLSIAVEASL